MKQNLRVSLGAVVLAIATLAAMIFAWLNFVQRTQVESPDDGVVWLDTSQGVQAWQVAPNSPAARAGVRPGDDPAGHQRFPGDQPGAGHQTSVRRRSMVSQVRYKLSRNGEEFETPLVTAPAEKPTSIENYGASSD